MARKKYKGIEYDTDFDYMAELAVARENKDDEYAKKLEQQRNAKIDGENIQNYGKTSFYTNSYGAGSASESRYGFGEDKNAIGSSRSGSINSALRSIENSKFSYDAQSDPVYKQYSTAMEKSADKATRSTLAQSAAMTGGVPSSYAVVASQNAGNAYREQADAAIPELYQLAYSMYADKRNDQYNRIELMRQLDNDEYQRHAEERAYRDNLTQLARENNLRETERLDALKENERNWNYQLNRDAINDSNDKKAWEYQLSRDAIEDERYKTEYSDKTKQQLWENEQYLEQVAYERALANLVGTGSSGGSDNGYSSGKALTKNYFDEIMEEAAKGNAQAALSKFILLGYDVSPAEAQLALYGEKIGVPRIFDGVNESDSYSVNSAIGSALGSNDVPSVRYVYDNLEEWYNRGFFSKDVYESLKQKASEKLAFGMAHLAGYN